MISSCNLSVPFEKKRELFHNAVKMCVRLHRPERTHTHTRMHTWSPSYDFTCACIIIIPLIELPHLLPVAILPPQILSQVFLFFSHSMSSALQHSIPLLSSSSLGRIVDVHLYKLISISSKPWFSLSAQRIDRHNARGKRSMEKSISVCSQGEKEACMVSHKICC